MLKNNKKILPSILLLLIAFMLTGCDLKDVFKKAILGNIPIVKNFINKDFNTYTSITGIKDEMKLVTAKQQLDFINIMDGKDGRYLEVSTYEVRAGVDLGQICVDEDNIINYPPVEIFSSSKIHSVVPRAGAEKNNLDLFENALKPVGLAYEQKAKDYSVCLGLLEKAKESAERTLGNMINIEADIRVDDYYESYPVRYLPFNLDIDKTYLSKHDMYVAPVEGEKFYRDALVIENTGDDGWCIRIGDSGRTFNGTFEEFYRTVFETNADENNERKDRVEIFRYFDPMFPEESEILGYASDYFRTMFVLNNGRIYYIDAVCDNEQMMLDKLSSTMVYLAASLRKINGFRGEYQNEYKNYISNFFDLQESIRTNSSRIQIRNNTDKLINSNILLDGELTEDERYFAALSDVKCLGRDDVQSVRLTGDKSFDDCNELITELLLMHGNFTNSEERDRAIRLTTELDTKIYKSKNIKGSNTQYLETWFLQNSSKFDLSDEDKKMYERDLFGQDANIASRPAILKLDDSQRNEYFYNLLRNHLSSANFIVDTAEVIDDTLIKSVRGSNMFVYFGIPKVEKMPDGDIYEAIKKQNGNHDISNSFILIFTQREWNFDSLFDDDDVHAIVLDDSTLRLFLNVAEVSYAEEVTEEARKVGQKILGTPAGKAGVWLLAGPLAPLVLPGIRRLENENEPVFFYYGDWKNLRVSPSMVTIAGHSFETKNVTKRAHDNYRNSNDYAQKSTIAALIEDLQHAYSNDDKEYYYDKLCDNLDQQVQRYVYDIIFRPSPRMRLDVREDKKHRYNY